ncbi:MAG: hypothetical protein RIA62_01285 [Cyclobacteriaceae bacterium]
MKKSIYLDRYAWKHPVFDPSQYHDADIIVVIPAFNESGIDVAINALQSCEAPCGQVLIMVIVNEPEGITSDIHQINQKAFARLNINNTRYRMLSCFLSLPKKKAGVGLARKIGMDEAVRIFNHHDKSGIITCFDSDCSCDPNFLVEIEKHFNQTNSNTALTFYEHPLQGENPEAITNYELYLRYYVDALRWAGFPYAFQTLGSCISVKSDAYERQGGMNTHKAGEDFYFIHKMTALGKISEINATTIYPSDRLSDRVPFGTGHAVNKYLEKGDPTYPVYAPAIFNDLKEFIDQIPFIYDTKSVVPSLPRSIAAYLKDQNFEQNLAEISNQTTDYQSFKKRFFHWFDGLKVLQLVHFCRDHHYKNVPVMEAIKWLNEEYLSPGVELVTKEDALIGLRDFDRKNPFHSK